MNRNPKGIPTGGQFATGPRSEADIELPVIVRSSREQLLSGIDEGSTYHESTDDSTPPGTHSIVAKIFGVPKSYLLFGDVGQDDAVILGHVDLRTGTAYQGGGVMGGTWWGKPDSFAEFHGRLTSTGDPRTDAPADKVWEQGREEIAKSMASPVREDGTRYTPPNPYREGSVQREAWQDGRESFARDMASPLDDKGMRPASTNPYA